MMLHCWHLFFQNTLPQKLSILFCQIASRNFFLCLALSTLSSIIHTSCPSTTPWSAAVNISNSGGITSNIFSAATTAGFMAVWADSSNNALYSFSSDGIHWQTGFVTAAQGNVAPSSDVFVAGNATGFLVTWIDSANNGWSSFSSNNGGSWSSAIQINPNTLTLNPNSDVYVGAGSSGFVATMIGNDNNAYVSFSTGTAAWSSPAQVTSDGSVYSFNQNSQTTRGFVSVTVVGNSCMLAWLGNLFPTFSAYFSSINPFSSTTVYPILDVGFFESACIVAANNGYFMAVARANAGAAGQTYFSVATIPSNWATFSAFTTNPANPDAGPWVAANQAGFMSTWIVGASANSPGTPMWTLSSNNGFNWTPVCSILATPSTTIGGPVGLSANTQGFIATWLDSSDLNAYASFYATPVPTPPTPAVPVSAPTLLQGVARKNIFLTQIELLNIITWSPPVQGIPIAYRIYRNARLTQLVATISSNTPLRYVDHNRQPNKTYTYYIVAIDASGNVSQPASIAIHT